MLGILFFKLELDFWMRVIVFICLEILFLLVGCIDFNFWFVILSWFWEICFCKWSCNWFGCCIFFLFLFSVLIGWLVVSVGFVGLILVLINNIGLGSDEVGVILFFVIGIEDRMRSGEFCMGGFWNIVFVFKDSWEVAWFIRMGWIVVLDVRGLVGLDEIILVGFFVRIILFCFWGVVLVGVVLGFGIVFLEIWEWIDGFVVGVLGIVFNRWWGIRNIFFWLFL